MVTPEVVEEVRRGCVERLFTGQNEASWEEIATALHAVSEAADHSMWGVERENLANFCYGMPLEAKQVIEAMTGVQI